jgi:hypothetical protein
VVVNLYRSPDEFVASMTTDSAGYYLFTGLVPGDYFVEFEPPEFWDFVSQDVGTDDEIDSDASGSTGRTATTSLAGGDLDITWDAGLYQPPTGVSIVYFEATGTVNAILLRWETVTEVSITGFNLYRANGPEGPRTQVNETLIESLTPPGSNNGAEYVWPDAGREPGIPFFYWVEAVDAQGRPSQTEGPVSAAAKHGTYLPVVIR